MSKMTAHLSGAGLTEATGPSLPQRKMSYEEFLEWCDEDTHAEWVDGKVIMFSPASKRHQLLKSFLLETIAPYVRLRGLGQILDAPFQMKLELSGREPDLLFVKQEHAGRLQSTRLEGPADLVVEIVSPESIGRDRGDKYVEYETAAVSEYWLIDPQRQQAEFYQLGSDGRYRIALADASGVYRSVEIPGFWLRVDWLWQDPLPSSLRAVAEIAGVNTELAQAFEEALRGGADK